MSPDERRRAFQARTEQYLRAGHDRLAAARFVAAAAGDLAGPALDVGTGKGLLAMALARRDLDVVSVDVNEEDSELAALLARDAGLAGRISFRLEDARSLPFAVGSFGCALMMDVLHHLDDAAPVAREMARVVRPHGKIVVADFTEDGFAMVAAIHRAEGREHTRSAVTVDAARICLAEVGWTLAGEDDGHMQRVAWFRKDP